MIDETELLVRLQGSCRKAGNAKKWAAKNGINFRYVYGVLKGENRPGPLIQRALGYRKVTMFEEIESGGGC